MTPPETCPSHSTPDLSPEWTEEKVYISGDEFFARFKQAIADAKNSIEIETYIFDLDPLGEDLLQLLAQAASRGVQVRVLLDGIGASEWSQGDAQKWALQGVEIRFFHPLPWQKHHRRFWRWPNFRWIVFGFRKLNHRDHRKLYIIDDDTAFVGSMNISARHLESLSFAQTWRDTSVCVKGVAIEALSEAFEFSWNSSEFYKIRRHRVRKFFSQLYPKVLLKDTDFRRKIYYQSLVSRVCGASRRLWITNPYFVPNQELLQCIYQASSSGADVRLLFPRNSDFFGVKYAMESYYTGLLESGARIFEYLPSMIHAKILMVDDWVSIGSSNLDHRSLFQDLEVDIVLSREENRKLVYAHFAQDLQASQELTLTVWEKRPWNRLLLEKFFHRFRAFL